MRVTNYHMMKGHGNTHVVSVLGHMPPKPPEFDTTFRVGVMHRSITSGALRERLRIQDESH